MGGRLSQELEVGDAVLVRRETTPESQRRGPTRFTQRVYPGTFVIRRKISPSTFVVEDLVDKDYVPSFHQPVHAERLIKLDMPELGLQSGQPRRIEMRESPHQPWNTYEIDRFGVDGRVRLSLADGVAQSQKWVDLTKCEYRWVA